MRPLETRSRIKQKLAGRKHSPERIAAITAGRRRRCVILAPGMRFGKWTVLSGPVSQNRASSYECRCDCGTVKLVAGNHLRRSRSRQCGKCVGRQNTEAAGLANKNARGRWLYPENGSRPNWLRVVLEEFFEAQAGICPICLRDLSRDFSDGCLDHDHATQEIRGLVHRGCNVLIGWFDRYPDIADRIAAYMQERK